MVSSNDEILTLGELAEKLKVSDEHIRRLIAAGKLVPTFAVGHAKRFAWADVCKQLGNKE